MQTESDAESIGNAGGGRQTVDIRDLSSADQLQQLEDLQIVVWGSAPRDIVPVHVLHIVATTGGIVVGAFHGSRPVGFAFGFLARRDGELYHASHMLGIHPDYQSHGIGARLKWAQRERALAQGLDLMTWTFDPLEARNAYFNLHKLGVISRTYKENVYGELDDDLNRGLPSDRLLVEWCLRDVPRERPEPDEDAPAIVANANGEPALRLEHDGGGELRIEIPSDFQRVKRLSPGRAEEWRLAVRTAMNWALTRGYVVRDFVGSAYILTPGKERDDAH